MPINLFVYLLRLLNTKQSEYFFHHWFMVLLNCSHCVFAGAIHLELVRMLAEGWYMEWPQLLTEQQNS